METLMALFRWPPDDIYFRFSALWLLRHHRGEETPTWDDFRAA